MEISITELPIHDPQYPEPLRVLRGSPEILYCRGDISLLSATCIAVVGTRQATAYGTAATQQLVRDLVRAGVVIVSGLALGIDAVAHRAALEAGGKTVAVLGCGVDDATIGPRQNIPLARDILKSDGLICSEHPAGTPADKWTFPARNRIVSGISRAVVVTEAAIKSGALITARLAAEQGRDVYAVPGSIFWPRSAGPHELIRNGAQAVSKADEILEGSGIECTASVSTVSTPDPVQRRIADILDDGPMHLDALIASSDMPTPRIMAALTHMELAGSVVNMQNGHWRRT